MCWQSHNFSVYLCCYCVSFKFFFIFISSLTLSHFFRSVHVNVMNRKETRNNNKFNMCKNSQVRAQTNACFLRYGIWNSIPTAPRLQMHTITIKKKKKKERLHFLSCSKHIVKSNICIFITKSTADKFQTFWFLMEYFSVDKFFFIFFAFCIDINFCFCFHRNVSICVCASPFLFFEFRY